MWPRMAHLEAEKQKQKSIRLVFFAYFNCVYVNVDVRDFSGQCRVLEMGLSALLTEHFLARFPTDLCLFVHGRAGPHGTADCQLLQLQARSTYSLSQNRRR